MCVKPCLCVCAFMNDTAPCRGKRTNAVNWTEELTRLVQLWPAVMTISDICSICLQLLLHGLMCELVSLFSSSGKSASPQDVHAHLFPRTVYLSVPLLAVQTHLDALADEKTRPHDDVEHGALTFVVQSEIKNHWKKKRKKKELCG